MSTKAIDDVIAERKRQIEVEGWEPGNDAEYFSGELAAAAACYALNAYAYGANTAPPDWPWDVKWWKPKDKRRDLVRAAALLLADIERLDKLQEE
ncbi:hypothetical protein [Nitrobacter sp.]|uniref:hypothetical protein n=1 Tax=Nitrobacter sp. TaxID=29420 RepID=UPI0029CAAEE1|nr:hypothetical protein [Nitrobacter sp.]